jgi:hypothetical protein
MVRRILLSVALAVVPLFATAALAQEQKPAPGHEADTSALGRQRTGIPTPDVPPEAAQYPDSSPTLTERQGIEPGPAGEPDEGVQQRAGQDVQREAPADAQKAGPEAEVGASTAALTAKLVDPEKKAKTKSATVQASAQGIQIIDPAQTNEQPKPGQGHFHYRLDNGPIIATTSDKLSFHELSHGKHTIEVTLAGNDHKPLGPSQTLNVTVP